MQLPAHASPTSLCLPGHSPSSTAVVPGRSSLRSLGPGSQKPQPPDDVLSPEAPPASCTELFAETLPFQLWKDFFAIDSDYILTESRVSSGFDAF